MDKYMFMCQVSDEFAKCETEEEIQKRAEEMTNIIKYQSELSKGYLRCGIL